eukprot:1121805-Amphidinium_carterae.1
MCIRDSVRARPPLHSYPNDLNIPGSDLHEVLFTMSRVIMCSHFRCICRNNKCEDQRPDGKCVGPQTRAL